MKRKFLFLQLLCLAVFFRIRRFFRSILASLRFKWYVWNRHREHGRKCRCQECKELIIAVALQTEAGRDALARAMIEPIRERPPYAK